MESPGEFERALADLGEPYVTYVKLLLEADDASRALHAAQIAGNRNARTDAELDRERAIARVMGLKNKVATAWLLGMRFAMELYPTQTQAVLDPAYRDELDRVEEAVVALERQMDEVETAVVAIENG